MDKSIGFDRAYFSRFIDILKYCDRIELVNSKMASQGQHHDVNVTKVLLLGHSFIAGFKRFLQDRDTAEHNVTLNLSHAEFLIQFSGRRGASIPRIRANLEIVEDFNPEICILQAGTNDICAKPLNAADSYWEEWVAGNLFALAQHLVNKCMVKRVVIMQILKRVEPTRPVKYPVDVNWFGDRCDSINRLVMALVQNEGHIFFWKHKGLFEHEHLSAAICDDGTHPNYELGYPKYYKNIRAAVVSMKKDLLK